MTDFGRRELLVGGAVAMGAIGTARAADGHGAAPAAPSHGTGHAAPAGAMTPDAALALLMEGNRRFLADQVAPHEFYNRTRRLHVAKGQSPFAICICCSDSRVSPELLFERGLGELFIIRVAGNTVDTAGMGSIEYAVEHLHAPLIVVMGHERCGAVGAACSVVTENASFPGSIGPMVEPIVPAALAVRDQPGDFVDNAVRANVRRVVHHLRFGPDPLLREPMAQGKLKVVGAYYDLDTGAVDFFDRA